MTHLFRVFLFLVLAAFCTAGEENLLFDHDELLAKAFLDGPGTEAISDPLQVLRHNPALKTELSDAIRDVENKYGFRIRLLIRPVWMGGTVQELASTLQNTWFPKGDGLVMILETDNRKLGLGVSMHGIPKDELWLMPTHASAAILKRVADQMNNKLPLDEYLKSLVLHMTAEHSKFLEKRLEKTTPASLLQENLFFFGALCVTALGALTVAALTRFYHAKEQHNVRRFPTVSNPERLGAPYGSGPITTRKFGHWTS